MELGHLVDYVMEYNRMHDYEPSGSKKKDKPKRRKATQADWDAFWG